MSWMDEIPSGAYYQFKPEFKHVVIVDKRSGSTGFREGMTNAQGDIILIATIDNKPVDVKTTKRDDGSTDYTYPVSDGVLRLEVIFPDDVTDKSLKVYPPKEKVEGEIFLETFTNNTFDLPWTNVQPAWLLGQKFCGTIEWGSDHSNDILDCSFLLNNKFKPSFSLGVEPGYIEPYARYLEIPNRGIFGHLWVTISAKIFEGLRTVFIENYNLEYQREKLSVNRFILGFVREAKNYYTYDGYYRPPVTSYTGIGVDLGNLARIFSGEYDNPVIPGGFPFHPKEGKPLYDVVKNENSISVRLWPLIEKIEDDDPPLLLGSDPIDSDPIGSEVISLQSYETWWNNYQSPVVPLGCANMVKTSEVAWYRDYPLFTDVPTHAVLHITNHYNYPSNYGIYKSGFIGYKGVV